MLGWHCLRQDWRTGSGPKGRKPWKVGDCRRGSKDPMMCVKGLHFCPRLIDTLGYAVGPVVCRVEVPDGSYVYGDKGVATQRKIIAGADCSDVLIEFAKLCVLEAIEREGEIPSRLARDVLDGSVTISGRCNTGHSDMIARMLFNYSTARAVARLNGDCTYFVYRVFSSLKYVTGFYTGSADIWADDLLTRMVKEQLGC